MEVDRNPSPSPIDSRHSSPFRLTATIPSGSQIIDRKRRRSLQSLSGPLSPSIDYASPEYPVGEAEDRDEERGPVKRRNLRSTTNNNDTAQHLYRPLGPAVDSRIAATENEYGVDSPMHFLSLASPSPPGESEDRSIPSDVDMGDGDSDSKNAPTFIPRQLKHTSLLRTGQSSTIPIRPSPLVQSERFQSSSTRSHSSNPTSSQSSSSEESMNRNHAATLDHHGSQSSSSNSSPGQTIRPLGPFSGKTRESPLGITRTPSPSPTPFSSQNENRKSHYSPGISQTSFPGGKHMLRYTMGYREDCSSCKGKIPGHYGHVMHR